MMPEAAIAFACRSAIAVSCGSILTVDRPCAFRYCEIISAMSSACASVAVIATTAPSNTALMTRFPYIPAMKQYSLAPDEADIGHLTLSAVDSSVGRPVMPSIFAVPAFAASGMGDQFARQDIR